MSRTVQIEAFLASHGYALARSAPLAQDASFRRYLRLQGDAPAVPPAILMDAPPPEDVRPFLRIARHLAEIGLSVPRIMAADSEAGLLIEEDLGDELFPALLDRAGSPPPADLFAAATDVLVSMHRAAPPSGLPDWSTVEMTETALGTLFDWWWPAVHGRKAPTGARSDVRAALAATLAPVAAGPKSFVHRDFFAGNLLWLPDRPGLRRIGVIDFQGAALGHPAYDLVSLLQDARRDIPQAIEQLCVDRYLSQRPDLDPVAFRAAYAACAAQRHLRVACQWVRLAQRDHRPHYLAFGPHTWALLARALTQPAAAPLAAALDRWIPTASRGNPPGLAA
jgi:aminoglycoside/choline kinase family phosphotransferase